MAEHRSPKPGGPGSNPGVGAKGCNEESHTRTPHAERDVKPGSTPGQSTTRIDPCRPTCLLGKAAKAGGLPPCCRPCLPTASIRGMVPGPLQSRVELVGARINPTPLQGQRFLPGDKNPWVLHYDSRGGHASLAQQEERPAEDREVARSNRAGSTRVAAPCETLSPLTVERTHTAALKHRGRHPNLIS